MTVSVSAARADLPSLLDAVEHGQEVTITRHGRPVAVLVGNEVLRQRRTARAFDGAARIHQLMQGAADQPLADDGAIDPPRVDELITQIRAGRDARA